MFSYNDLTPKTYFMMDGEPYEVLESQVSRKQANKPVNKTKIRNLISGSVIDHTFHVSDKLKPADMGKRTVKYLYINEKKGEMWFCDPDNPKDRFTLPDHIVEEVPDYIPENGEVELLTYMNSEGDDEPIGIRLPIKVDLTVAEAPPSIKGNTSSGGDKKVVLETGLSVTTPLFIEVGDVIRVKTETASYIERVSKA